MIVATILSLAHSLSAASTEFLLPLAGETVQDSIVPFLVRAPSNTVSMTFLVRGAKGGKVTARPVGDGLFAGEAARLASGDWSLRVDALDSAGRLLSRDSISFSTANLDPSIASTTSGPVLAAQPVSAPQTKSVQSLYLAFDAGYRQGMSEGRLESWRPLSSAGTELVAGGREVVLDRSFSGSATARWDYRYGNLRLRTRTVADLADQSGQTQPFHRLSIDGAWGPWLDVHVGDQYPAWSPLIMDGVRIRGFGAGLTATHDGNPWGRVRYATGWTRRATDASIQTYTDGTTAMLGANYDRYVQALHVGFGGGSTALWGLTAIHSIDDTSGVDMLVQDSLGATRPRENLALETDLQLWFWKRRIEVFGHAAATLVTDNVRLGTANSQKSKDAGLGDLDFLSPVIDVNSSTRGLPRLMGETLGGSEIFGFLGDNAAARAGVRWSQPMSETDDMSNEIRWVHTGPEWESFTRGSALPAQTGMEFNHSSNWAHQRLFLSTTAGIYVVPRKALQDADRTRLSATASLAPDDALPGAYIDGGKDWTEEGGGEETKNWNAGVGLFRSFHPGEGHIATTSIGYSRSLNNSQLDTTASIRSRFAQDSWNGLVRWRFPEPVEVRTGAQFVRQSTSLRMVSDNQSESDNTIHGSLGATVWLANRAIEASLDGGIDHRAVDDGESGIRQWNQSSRMVWNLPSDQSVRLSQRFVQVVDGRGDLRIDAGWEKFF